MVEPPGRGESKKIDGRELLRLGSRGQQVILLRDRLAAFGFPSEDDPQGQFGDSTYCAVRSFQESRGLRVDGICGPQTWSSLAEAGFGLGDRLIVLKSPMLRGDDVAELQQRLGELGFDTGRVDGIFGPETSSALAQFQRNVGLVPDGIFGKASAAELDRLSIRGGGPSLMAEVKERELLRQSPRTLDGQTITIGYDPGLEKLVGKVTAILKNVGANVSMDCEPDGSTQAKVANLASASLHLSFSLNDGETGFSMAYYSGFKFESAGGKALAQSIQDRLSAIVPARDSHPLGMALPVLRETRMTAVSCDMGSHVANEGQLGLMAQAIFDALVSWASETWD